MTTHPSPTAGADDAIAIVGLAGVYPGAATAAGLWDNVVNRVDAITDVPEGRWDPVFFDPQVSSADRFPVRRGGFVDDVATFDPLAFGIMPVAAQSAEPDQLLALGAAAAALADAGNPHERVDPRKAGVVLGRGGYIGDGVARLDQRVRTAQQVVEVLRSVLPGVSEDHLQQVKAEFQAALGPEQSEGAIGLVPNLAASRIANRFDFRGPAWTVDAACASSLIAVDQAMAQLRSGQLDLALAGGVHHTHDLTLWSVFSQLGALSPTSGIRPFSRSADGILVGEGTGVLVLRRLADALADGDRIYAVLRGTGVASDGRSSSLMSPAADGQMLAVEAAWRASGLDPADVGLIEAHGTATPLGDSTELDTLRTVFGAAGSAAPRAGLGSIKSMIGHAMPAAGAAGLIKTALAIHHGVLPPTLHVEDPNADVEKTRFRLITEAEPWESDTPRIAGVNAFGFGGINAHAVLTEAPGSRVGAVDPVVASPTPLADVEPVLLLAGADADDLLAQLEALDTSPAALATRPLPTGGPARLAIVAPDDRRLTLARKVLARGTPFRGRNDVWFDPTGVLRDSSVAFLYPGVEPEFDPHVDDIAELFDLSLGDLATLSEEPSLQEKGRGILELGRILTSALERLGVEPDEIAGHSMGEWTGLLISGIAPADDVDRFLADLRPGEMQFPDVVFVALGASAETADEIVDGLDDAYVSHDNCPHQSVICAPEALIPTIMERAAERRAMAVEMPFRSGFHSPLFAPYASRMISLFDQVAFTTPHTRLWSATSVAPYPSETSELAELSGRHLVEQVRFRALVERLHAEGVRGFVQVGTGSLGGFLDDTLRGQDVVTVSAHTDKTTGLGGLLRTVVALWSGGRDVDLSPLFPAAKPAVAEAKPSRATPLKLGSTLVRGLAPLPVAAQPAAVASAPAARADVDAADLQAPWGQDFLASVSEATAAVEQVLAAARNPQPVRTARPPQPVAPPAAAQPATPPAAAPAEAPTSRTTTHRLSVADQPWWIDHAFYPQPDGWPVLEDRFPLVPMTGLIEMMADEAMALVPGTVAIAVENVRAFRWLAVEPVAHPVFTATIDAKATAARTDGATVVRTTIEGHARAQVVLATSWPEPPSRDTRTLSGDIGAPPLERVYPEGHLFHGPSYQGLRRFDLFAEDGAHGLLESQPATGALLDNAGQLFGYWVACKVDRDKLVLPTSVDSFTFFGPQPEPGTTVECIVYGTALDDVHARADLELLVDGRIWCRIDGWEDRRFQSDAHLFGMLREPHKLLARQQAGGWWLVREEWPDSASREVVMRRFLGANERPAHLAKNPRAQRSHLLGRIAAKDSVRGLLAEAGNPGSFPGEIEVHNRESGQPYLTSPIRDWLTGFDIRVSLAHSGGLGVAIAADGVDVGIDVEKVEPRSDTFAANALGTKERALFDAYAADRDRDRELTRWWAAKEAVSKAGGTGLGFRQRDLAVEEIVPTDSDGSASGDVRLRIGQHWVTTTVIPHPDTTHPDTTHPVTTPTENSTTAQEEYVVAWTDHTHPRGPHS